MSLIAETRHGVALPAEIVELGRTDERVAKLLRRVRRMGPPPAVRSRLGRIFVGFALSRRSEAAATLATAMVSSARGGGGPTDPLLAMVCEGNQALDELAEDGPGAGGLNGFVGQTNLVRQLRVAGRAAFRGVALPHMLMVGPPGLGKTELARALGVQRGGRIRVHLAEVLNSEDHLAGSLMSLSAYDLLFIDELHQLRADRQALLLTVLQEGKLHVGGKRYGKPMTVSLPPFTLLAATTDEHAVLEPLRERFGMRLTFDFYEVHDLVEILRARVAARAHMPADDDALAEVARRGRGVPRRAIHIMEAARRFACSRSRGARRVCRRDVEEACALQGVDGEGLDEMERQYLAAFAAGGGRPLTGATIAAKLGVPRATVTQVLEPIVLRMNLVECVDRGRRLTDAGRAYLAAG